MIRMTNQVNRITSHWKKYNLKGAENSAFFVCFFFPFLTSFKKNQGNLTFPPPFSSFLSFLFKILKNRRYDLSALLSKSFEIIGTHLVVFSTQYHSGKLFHIIKDFI